MLNRNLPRGPLPLNYFIDTDTFFKSCISFNIASADLFLTFFTMYIYLRQDYPLQIRARMAVLVSTVSARTPAVACRDSAARTVALTSTSVRHRRVNMRRLVTTTSTRTRANVCRDSAASIARPTIMTAHQGECR